MDVNPKEACREFLEEISEARFQESLKNVADELKEMMVEMDQLEADGVIDPLALNERSTELGKQVAVIRRGDLLILYQAAVYGALVIDEGEM
tara:strand:- start:2628 stop:2903 length:276 start_codon:yes stop_codon:yes gene_type:complete